MKKIATTVAISVPPMTPVPIECRLLARAVAIASGTVPSTKANEVITIGAEAAGGGSTAARVESIDLPSGGSNSTANSTIRIAFFAARPMSGEQADLEVQVVGMPRSAIADQRAEDRERHGHHDPIGSDQLSYCAARIRNTNSRPNTKAIAEVEPRTLLARLAGPLVPVARGHHLGDDLLHRLPAPAPERPRARARR